MRNLALTALALGVVACDGGGVQIPVDTGDTSGFTDGDDTGTPDDTDTGEEPRDTDEVEWPSGNQGSLSVIHLQPDHDSTTEEVVMVGLFSDSNQGFVNASECVVLAARQSLGLPCLTALPSGGDTYVDASSGWERSAASKMFNLGLLQFGTSYEATSAYDSVTQIGYNYGLNAGPWQAGESLGLVVAGGEWGPYTGSDDIVLPSEIEATAPATDQRHAFLSDEVVTIEWETGGSGDVHLWVLADGVERWYSLDDDGSFELDLSALPFASDATRLDFGLTRLTTSSLDHNGNTVDVIARSEQRWRAELINISDRDPVVPTGTCGDVDTTAPLGVGSYYGDVTSSSDDLDPGEDGCTDAAATGNEGIVAVEIPASTLWTATYALEVGKAAGYLVTDCEDEATCLAGDTASYLGNSATVQYYNESDEPMLAYLVLDATDATGLFYLDIETTPVDFLAPADTCGDAAPTLGTGRFYGDLSSYGHDMDHCTSTRVLGREGVVKVDLASGERITVSLEQQEARGALYFMADCDDDATCIDGTASTSYSTGGTISESYTNMTADPQSLWLVIDAVLGTDGEDAGAFWLDVERELQEILVVGDTCDDAKALPNLEAGVFIGTVNGFEDDLDPVGVSGCTGYKASGKEGIVPVELEAGETLEVDYSFLSGGDTSIYLVEDCADANTCIEGSDSYGADTLTYKNDTDATQNLFLVLDGYSTTSDFRLEVEFK